MYNGTVSPFRKNNQYSCYISVGSNDCGHIFKHFPNAIIFRLSTDSSNKNIFTQNGDKNRGYKDKLVYKTMDEAFDVCNRRYNRTREIILFPPPYKMTVANKSDKGYLDY